MDPMFDLVRERTQDLRRTADTARRERELRGSTTTTPEHRPNATVSAAVELDVCAGPCLPAGTARAA